MGLPPAWDVHEAGVPIIRAQIPLSACITARRHPMNLLKAASTVSLLTLASRVSGLVREQLIAAVTLADQAGTVLGSDARYA